MNDATGSTGESTDAVPDGEPGQSITVVCDADDADPLSTNWLRDHLDAAAGQLAADVAWLSVVIVDDARMAELHHRFMDIDETTDVLTFDLRDAEAGAEAPIEGEVYVCRDEAARQASQRGHALGHELLLYAVHGLLHLAGYDDHEPDDHAAMHGEEDRLLEAIGVGRVYDPSPTGERT